MANFIKTKLLATVGLRISNTSDRHVLPEQQAYVKFWV